MESIVREHEVDHFLSKIKNNFPNFIAGIITDINGFPIASKIPQNFHIKEQELALSAIADERKFIDDKEFIKVIRALNESNSVKLFILLEKTNKYINRFKNLKRIIEKQKIF